MQISSTWVSFISTHAHFCPCVLEDMYTYIQAPSTMSRHLVLRKNPTKPTIPTQFIEVRVIALTSVVIASGEWIDETLLLLFCCFTTLVHSKTYELTDSSFFTFLCYSCVGTVMTNTISYLNLMYCSCIFSGCVCCNCCAACTDNSWTMQL